MDETLVRGLVIGLALMIVGIAANLIWKLLKSESEGARRLKLVLKLGGAAALIMLILAAPPADKPVLIGLAVVIGVGVWVFRGYRK